MSKKSYEKGRQKRKLHNYILHFKSGFICLCKKLYSRLSFRNSTQVQVFLPFTGPKKAPGIIREKFSTTIDRFFKILLLQFLQCYVAK